MKTTCARRRAEAEALLATPAPLRRENVVVDRLTAIVTEALDRAEHGCSVCGSLIARPDGTCQVTGGDAA